MTDLPDKPVGSPLAAAAAANDIVIIGDPDHTDTNIAASMDKQLMAMRDAGVKTLYIEHDPRDVSMEEIRADQTSYGAMVRNAESLGIRVVEYDDRSAARKVDAAFPDAAKFARANDVYFTDPDALIAKAPDQEQMRNYIDAKRAELNDIGARNTAITDTIAADMRANPGKAVVMIGDDHVNRRNDVDEGLRDRGYRTTTVSIISADTSVSIDRAAAPDKADFVMKAETGDVILFKDPQTSKLQAAMAGITLPWKNTEPVKDLPDGAQVAPAAGAPAPVRTQDGPPQR